MPIPARPEDFRTVDMTGSNEWGALAHDWACSKDDHSLHEQTKKELKALVEADVGLIYGHGVQIKRSKNGALRFSEREAV